MKLYKNGLVVVTQPNVEPYNSPEGCSFAQIGGYDTNDNLFVDAMEEVRIWDHVVSKAQILENINLEMTEDTVGLIA